MKIFYIRCSTAEQNEARQMEMAREHKADKIFIDKASGKDTEREQFKKMLDYAREGDIIITESISRISRNTRDLLNTIDILTEKQVDFISLKENIDTSTPQGKFILTVFGALAELERESILQRQREGVEIAKREGKFKGRRETPIDEERFKKMCLQWRAGERTAVSIYRAFGMTAPTFYKKVKERNL